MTRTFFVGYNNTESENPHAVHAIIPPLQIEVGDGEDVSDDIIRQGIATRAGIPIETVQLLGYREFSK